MKNSLIERALIVPGLPHPLLAPDKSPGWAKLRASYTALGEAISASDADIVLYFSTQWPSVIGYLFQANPHPEWVHVDHEWHEYGSMPYKFTVDADFAKVYAEEVRTLGYNAALVNYRGFPIDTGTIVAQSFLNPHNKIPAAMVSCGLYAEKEETLQIGRAASRALARSGKRAIVVLVSALSHRFFTHEIDPREDKISSAKDDEWNQKILELLAEGRLEDVSQVAREFAREANGDMGFKGIWWLAGLCGESNSFTGKVHHYAPVWGTGNAIVELLPTAPIFAREDPPSDPFDGEGMASERADLGSGPLSTPETSGHAQPLVEPIQHSTKSQSAASANSRSDSRPIYAKSAAEPVGPYPHARREGEFLFVSGMGPREPGQKEIPGVTLNSSGDIIAYDVEVQTRSTVRNIQAVLAAAGLSLEHVVDVQAYLTNMKIDFPVFNRVYGEYFGKVQATRTTIEVGSLPTPIAVELKVIARFPST